MMEEEEEETGVSACEVLTPLVIRIQDCSTA